MAAPESTQPAGEQALRERVSQLERDLAVARERLRNLQELDQIYTDFTHAVSHELRTPLTLISGYAQQLLLRWTATDEARRYTMVEKINVSSRRLARLIDDILLMADVEEGELPMHVKDVALREIVDQALNEVRDRYPRGLPAIAAHGGDVAVLADGFRLEQVLIYLLDNAVKHSPPGATVTVSWTCQGDRVVIAVADQGQGIDPSDLPRLFRRFGRVQRTIGQSHGGVGLGLYIARRLIEAMHGRIWTESTPGEGSTFYVSVPASPRRLERGDRP